jgi:hypothetical protein
MSRAILGIVIFCGCIGCGGIDETTDSNQDTDIQALPGTSPQSSPNEAQAPSDASKDAGQVFNMAWCSQGFVGCKTWSATDGAIGHICGRQEAPDVWGVNTSQDSGKCHMSYGPYDGSFGSGYHTAYVDLLIDYAWGDDVVAKVDVVTNVGRTVLAQRQIRRREFIAGDYWTTFAVPFWDPCYGGVEVRVEWWGTSYLRHRRTTICR